MSSISARPVAYLARGSGLVSGRAAGGLADSKPLVDRGMRMAPAGKERHGLAGLCFRDEPSGRVCHRTSVRQAIWYIFSVLEVWGYITQLAFTTWAVFFIVLRDERALPPERLERAWPPTTRNLALVVLGVFALPFHYVRTRRSVLGFLVGLGLAVAVTAVNAILLGALDFFFGDAA